MKIITEPLESPVPDTGIPGEDAFFEGLSPELLSAVCRGLDAPMHPMALVSEQLMVLRQTHSCGVLLAYGGFYSLQDVLTPSECDAVQQSLRTGTEHSVPLVLAGETTAKDAYDHICEAAFAAFGEENCVSGKLG